MGVTQRSWAELTPRQRRLTALGAATELALTTWAAIDLARRRADSVRGPRALWAGLLVVQPVGPIAYLAWGRGPRDATHARAPESRWGEGRPDERVAGQHPSE